MAIFSSPFHMQNHYSKGQCALGFQTTHQFIFSLSHISMNLQHQSWRKPVRLFRGNKLIECNQWEENAEEPWLYEIPEPLWSFFLVIGVQVTVNNSSAKRRRQYNVISSSCISVFLSKRWKSTSQPKTAFQCYGRLSTRIIPGLKPGEIEGREKITEASPQHGGVRSKGQSCMTF